jgi:hypothetical protein
MPPRRKKPAEPLPGVVTEAGDQSLLQHTVDSVLDRTIATTSRALDSLEKEIQSNPKFIVDFSTVKRLESLAGTLTKLSQTQLRLQRAAKDRARKLSKEQRKAYSMDFLLSAEVPWKEAEEWMLEFRRRHNERVAKEGKSHRVFGFDPEAPKPKGSRARPKPRKKT